jgi:flagellar motor switch protein FliG
MSDGITKSAVLLYSLGTEAAADVMSRLDPRVVQKIGVAIASLKGFDKEKTKEILDEFHGEVSKVAALGMNTEEYVKTVMSRILGEDRAKPVVNRILQKEEQPGIRDLKWMDSSSMATMLKLEHPQIIAAILSYLDRDQAGEVLGFLPDAVRDEVVIRAALLDGVQPDAFQDLNVVLSRLVAQPMTAARAASKGGVRMAAELLNGLPRGEDQKIIERIKDVDAELAGKIMDEMFVFDDLVNVDDKGMQAMMRNIEQKVLVTALKGAKQEMKDKIFKNMSSRQAEMVQDEMSSMPPMRLSDVEAAQKEIVKIARGMADSGEITIAGKGGEELV